MMAESVLNDDQIGIVKKGITLDPLHAGEGSRVGNREIFELDFEAQIKDSINRYWGKTQHDLIFSGGLLWRIR